jgi:hypothetical protein
MAKPSRNTKRKDIQQSTLRITLAEAGGCADPDAATLVGV